ncbi:hypothetical protein HPB50_004204 [Hyalomma asiaticum]|uniref:Uncharacterized protein n=1 Tax=Hyalomma asiaticum TaxID=266040 RepID=A0ACB7TEL4_HYAAI|nr:hypothetical protein HPB50_004204 [Hyalomma asiaticum]
MCTRCKPQKTCKSCFRCGLPKHRSEACPQVDGTWFECDKKGHFQRGCRGGGSTSSKKKPGKKNVKMLSVISQKASTLSLNGMSAGKFDPVTVQMTIDGVLVNMELDIGAAASVMSMTQFRQLFGCTGAHYSKASYQHRNIGTTPGGSFTWNRHKGQLLERITDPDHEASDLEGSEFLAFQLCVDPVTYSAPTTSDDPKVKQNTQVDVEPQSVDTENGQLIQAALQKRVAQLETQLQATRRKLQLDQRQRLRALTANKRLVAGLNKYLNEDQVKCLKMATMQGTQWTKKTVIKALKMRLSCGARGYDSVRELGQPLPTERTLHRHLEGYKFTPGLLEDIMESLALKVSLMSPEERHATLMLDEMQLAPGLVYNPSSGTVLGAPAIPLADATLPPDSLGFGQDALENLFSTLRCKNPVPRVLEFKSSLRAATMAQFLRPMMPLDISRTTVDVAVGKLVEISLLEYGIRILREGAPGPRKRTRRPPTKRAPKKPLSLEPDTALKVPNHHNSQRTSLKDEVAVVAQLCTGGSGVSTRGGFTCQVQACMPGPSKMLK